VEFPFLNPCLKEDTIQCIGGSLHTNSLN
jgi:hypothetical protein